MNKSYDIIGWMDKYKARLAEKRPLDDKERFWRYDFELIKPHRIEFEAGQYVDMKLDGGEVRKFWMCSQPEEEHGVDFVVDSESETLGSREFVKLEPGGEVEFEGPKGKRVEKNGKEKLYFVAEGVGIAPIRSVVLDLLETRRDSRVMKLLWGLGYVEEMFWAEDFYQLSQDFSNFDQQITLSHPPMPEWHLSSGRVEQILMHEEIKWSEYVFVVAGFGKMIARVKAMLEEKSVSEEKVIELRFGN